MRSAAVSFILLLAAGGTAQAQECLSQIRFPEVGRWAEYRAVYNGQDPHTVRYAVIGREKREGKDLKWIELRTTGDTKDKTFIYQILVPGSPAQMGEVQEVVFKPGERPAMKMNGMMMNMIRGQMEKQNFFSEVCKGVNVMGMEKVAVPAGKFLARHFHSAKYNSDSWITSAIPFGLVKSVGKTYQMELAVYGKGAKSSITEQPQEMQGMGGPNR